MIPDLYNPFSNEMLEKFMNSLPWKRVIDHTQAYERISLSEVREKSVLIARMVENSHFKLGQYNYHAQFKWLERSGGDIKKLPKPKFQEWLVQGTLPKK